MYEHHQRTIERLTALLKDDPRFEALIISGSIAKGLARPDSDIDVVLVATEAEYQKRLPTKDFWYLNQEICDYSNGYVEGKVVNLQFLQEATEFGSEPARWAFSGAWVAFSHIPDLENLIKRIPVYPQAQQAEKITAFYSQVMLLTWFMGEAEKRNDRYLLLHAVSDLALYGGRLILAYNQILYPYHKWFTHAVAHAPLKPDNFMELMQQMLEQPSKATALAFRDSVVNWRDWGVTYDQAVVRFVEDSEWNWRTGYPPLADS